MTRTPSETRTPRGREAWLEAALDTLAEVGVDGLRVEALAKRLGLTKGSFYWHFRDRPSLLIELLERWREGRMDAIHRHAGNGAATPRETKKAASEEGAFGLHARDAFLEDGDAAGDGAATRHSHEPDFVGM